VRASHAISPRYAQTLRSGAGSPPIHPPWAVDSGGRGQHADGPAAVRCAEEEVSGVVLGAGKGNADVQQVLGFRQTADSSDLPKWRIQVRVLLPTPATCSLRAHLYVAGAPFACCCGRIVECARCPPRPDRQKQGERASMQSCCVRRHPIATAQRFAHPVYPTSVREFCSQLADWLEAPCELCTTRCRPRADGAPQCTHATLGRVRERPRRHPLGGRTALAS